jgi:hypothetical protein
MDPQACGKAGPVALITVWGSVSEKVRMGIVEALDTSGLEEGGGTEVDRGVQSWRGLGKKTLRQGLPDIVSQHHPLAFCTLVSLVKQHPMTRQAICVRLLKTLKYPQDTLKHPLDPT